MDLDEPEHFGGQGEPLVLLHGLACGWTSFAPVIPGLERHHRVSALTLPGHRGGRPLGPGVGASVRTLTDGVEARLDALGLDRPHVAGNSLGGWIGLELARRGRARSVTALAPAGGWDAAKGIDVLVRLASLAYAGASRLRVAEWAVVRRPRGRRLLLGAAFAHPERVHPALAVRLLQDVAGCDVFVELVAALARDGPIVSPVEAADCPVTVAWGTADRVIPFEPYGRLVLDAVPAARAVHLPDAGHLPMADAPDAVVRAIRETAGRA